ncbi:hypothetical protein Rsub_08941 [Raphidocelis subcapitata]|uniref:CBM1 domain-containing protein n=1 Tax=Raphidocelis subcapitata TaxID=307507 RepID=A0A2V0PG76_9CHLO|nr:hypothetical protein Rsub_08941 [Raphidocelis subcapitata]|eukprot:GBF96065.1 hypothetical protein Rsub_08941 [Raphidocelis subcapitata]
MRRGSAPLTAALLCALLAVASAAQRQDSLDASNQWGTCGGLNGPNQEDAAGAACPEGFTCVRLDRWFWQCRESKEAGSALAHARTIEPYAQCGGKNGHPDQADAVWPDTHCAQGYDCERQDESNYRCMPSTAQSTSPADGSAESYDANIASSPPEAIRLGLTFPGLALGEFTDKYARGALAAVARVSGVDAAAISASYATAADAASPETSRRKLTDPPAGRRLAQAEAGGVAALYALSASDREGTLQRLEEASANDGAGFAAALSGEGVPIRPEVSVNGVVRVPLRPAAPPSPSPAPKDKAAADAKDAAPADKEPKPKEGDKAKDKAAADKEKDKAAPGKSPAPAAKPAPPPAQVAATARGNKAGVVVGAVVSGLVGTLLLALAVVVVSHQLRERDAKKAKKAAAAAADIESGNGGADASASEAAAAAGEEAATAAAADAAAAPASAAASASGAAAHRHESASAHPQAFLPELPESGSAGGAGNTGGGASDRQGA